MILFNISACGSLPADFSTSLTQSSARTRCIAMSLYPYNASHTATYNVTVVSTHASPDYTSQLIQLTMWMVFGVLFYFVVVSKFPKSISDLSKSKDILKNNALNTTFSTACCKTNFWLAWCCYPARQAMNFHVTGTMNYWPALVLSTALPCCMTWYARSCSPMLEQLGGEKANCCVGCMEACCCSCCVVTQHATAIDAAYGAETGCCGVAEARDGDEEAPPPYQTMTE